MTRPLDRASRGKAIHHTVGAALLTLVLGLGSSAVSDEIQADIVVLKAAPKIDMSLPSVGKGPQTPTPNPYLSWLPVESNPNIREWQQQLHEVALERRASVKGPSGATKPSNTALIPVSEGESSGSLGFNDTGDTAEFIAGFGTGTGDDGEADVSGEFAPESTASVAPADPEDEGDINKATIIPILDRDRTTTAGLVGDGPYANVAVTVVPDPGPFAEDDGDIGKASDTGVLVGEQVTVAGTIGDGPFGSGTGTPSGDFDFYSFTITGSQTVFIEVNQAAGSSLDTIVALWDANDTFIALNDDAGATTDSQIIITLSCTPEPACYPQTFYIGVGGFTSFPTTPASFLSDVRDSSTGPGAGSEGDYELTVTMPTFAPGDFDFYGVAALAGDLITVEVDTDAYFDGLDPMVAVFNSAGSLIALNDDDFTAPFFTLDSFVAFQAPADDTYYVAVGGFNPFASPTSPLSFPSNPFDSSSGPGPGIGSEGSYDLILSKNDVDIDFFSFDLEPGDIIATNLLSGLAGHGPIVVIEAPNGDLLKSSASDHAGSLPSASTLPGGGIASSAYVVSEAGTYKAGIGYGTGAYTLELRALRPPAEATGTRQRLFIDFDGATIDTSRWGANIDPGDQPVTLSPLSSFLGAWGLTPGDENAVIDAILASVEESLKSDIEGSGENPTFDIEILNSRDHADPTGDPDVSRVIVGGTISESGIQTIGIAESIDIGNFDQSEDALVLLDLLSAPIGDPNSLNTIPVVGGATKIDLVGTGVGNVTAHEAGHFFANYHTDNGNSTPNIMDTGGNLGNLVGIGLDGAFGSGDDVDVDFGKDTYEPSEGFGGTEDTMNSIAFGLTTGPGGFQRLVGVSNIGGSAAPEVGVVLSGSLNGYVRDGSSDALLGTQTFSADRTPLDVGVADINGSPAIAVLVEDATGRAWVEVKDADTGALIRNVWFSAGYSPIALAVLPDMNGNNSSEVAVLMTKDSDNRAWVHIKDAETLAYVNNVWFSAGFTPLDVEMVPNLDGNAGPEVAVLMTRDSDGRTWVHTKDAGSGAYVRDNWFQAGFTPKDLAIIDNLDANPGAEVAVLFQRDSDSRTWVHMKDTLTGAYVKNVWFDAGFTPTRLKTVPDLDNNVGDELAVLSTKDADGRAWVLVRDALSGAFIRNVWFQGGFDPKDFAVLPDFDANPGSELAVLGEKTNGQVQVEIKDTKTNAFINQVNFP